MKKKVLNKRRFVITCILLSMIFCSSILLLIEQNKSEKQKEISTEQIEQVVPTIQEVKIEQIIQNKQIETLKKDVKSLETKIVGQKEEIRIASRGLTKNRMSVLNKDGKLTEKQLEHQIYLLGKMVGCENESQKPEALNEKIAICKVILNRVESPNWPDTLEKVLFQKKQFSPVWDGRWEGYEPTDFDLLAAKLALQGEEVISELGNPIDFNTFYYMNPDCSSEASLRWAKNDLVEVGRVGKHVFYKDKN